MQYHLDNDLWMIKEVLFTIDTCAYVLKKSDNHFYYNFPEKFNFLIDTIVLDNLEYTCKLFYGNIVVEPI